MSEDKKHRQGLPLLLMVNVNTEILEDVSKYTNLHLTYLRLVDSIIEFFKELERSKVVIDKYLRDRPYKLHEQAVKLINEAERACKEGDSELFEQYFVFAAIVLRAAVDASLYALAIWLLERGQKWRGILKTYPGKEQLADLVARLSWDHLSKASIILVDDYAYKAIDKLWREHDKLSKYRCWELRNIYVHGRPIYTEIKEPGNCRIIAPIEGHTLTLEDLKEFAKRVKEYLEKLEKTTTPSKTR